MDRKDLNTLRTIDELRGYVAEIDARHQELDREAMGLPLSDEAREEWDAIAAQRIEASARIEELEAREDYLRRIVGDERAVERPGSLALRPRAGSRLPDDVFDLAAYRSIARTDEDYERLITDGARKAVDAMWYPHPAADQAAIKEDQHKLLANVDRPAVLSQRILAVGSELYARAFAKEGIGQPLDATERNALATGARVGALTLDTDTQGGLAVPYQLDPTVILTSAGSMDPLRSICRVERITGREWQNITSSGASVVRGAETDEAPDTQFALGPSSVATHEVKGFVRFSIKLQTSWSAVLSQIARILDEAKADEEASGANGFLLGDGTGTNAGGLIGTMPAGRNVASGTANTFAPGDVYKTKNSVGARFRKVGRFLAETSIYDLVRQFDTNGGSNMWVQLADPTPAKLIGYAAHEHSGMDATAATADKPLVFGDFDKFLIAERIGSVAEIVPHVLGANRRPTGERGLLSIWSNNSAILVPEAFALLVIA